MSLYTLDYSKDIEPQVGSEEQADAKQKQVSQVGPFQLNTNKRETIGASLRTSLVKQAGLNSNIGSIKNITITDSQSGDLRKSNKRILKETTKSIIEIHEHMEKVTAKEMDLFVADRVAKQQQSILLEKCLEELVTNTLTEALKYDYIQKTSKDGKTKDLYSESNIAENLKLVDKTIVENSSMSTHLEKSINSGFTFLSDPTYIDERKVDTSKYDEFIGNVSIIFKPKETNDKDDSFSEEKLQERFSKKQYSSYMNIMSLFETLLESDSKVIETFASEKQEDGYGGNFLTTSGTTIVGGVKDAKAAAKTTAVVEAEETSSNKINAKELLTAKKSSTGLQYAVPASGRFPSLVTFNAERCVAAVSTIVNLHDYDEKVYKSIKEKVSATRKKLTEAVLAFTIHSNELEVKDIRNMTEISEKYKYDEDSTLQDYYKKAIKDLDIPSSSLYFLYKETGTPKEVRKHHEKINTLLPDFDVDKYKEHLSKNDFTKTKNQLTDHVNEIVSILLKNDEMNLALAEQLWARSSEMITSPELTKLIGTGAYINPFVDKLIEMLQSYTLFFKTQSKDIPLDIVAGRSKSESPIIFKEMFYVSKLPSKKSDEKKEEVTVCVSDLIKGLYAKSLKAYRPSADKKSGSMTVSSLSAMMKDIVLLGVFSTARVISDSNFGIFSKMLDCIKRPSNAATNELLVQAFHLNEKNAAQSHFIVPDLYSNYADIIDGSISDRYTLGKLNANSPLLLKASTYLNKERKLRSQIYDVDVSQIRYKETKAFFKIYSPKSSGGKTMVNVLSILAMELTKIFSTYLLELFATLKIEAEKRRLTEEEMKTLSETSPAETVFLHNLDSSTVNKYVAQEIFKAAQNAKTYETTSSEVQKQTQLKHLRQAITIENTNNSLDSNGASASPSHSNSDVYKLVIGQPSTKVKIVDELCTSIEEAIAQTCRFNSLASIPNALDEFLGGIVYKTKIGFLAEDREMYKYFINSALTCMADRASMISTKGSKDGKQIVIDSEAMDICMHTFSD